MQLYHTYIIFLFKKKIYYDSEDEAVNSVRTGNTWGALVVNGNYSYSLKDRIENYFQISNDSLAQSSIKYYADQTEMPAQLTFGSMSMNYL